jgi:hypothetical protein
MQEEKTVVSLAAGAALWWGLVLFWPNRDWPGRGGWELRAASLFGRCGGRGGTRLDQK